MDPSLPLSRRTLIAAAITAALFLLVLVLLGARMASGEDPVVGAEQRSGQSAAIESRRPDQAGDAREPVPPQGADDDAGGALTPGGGPGDDDGYGSGRGYDDDAQQPSYGGGAQGQGAPPVQSGTS